MVVLYFKLDDLTNDLIDDALIIFNYPIKRNVPAIFIEQISAQHKWLLSES